MTDRATRTLFLHSWTEKALLVSPTPAPRDAERLGGWLPLSMITVGPKRTVYNQLFGSSVGIALMRGTVADIDCPVWLLDEKGLTESASLTDQDFICPALGRCPHGEPLNHECGDCRTEHGRATA